MTTTADKKTDAKTRPPANRPTRTRAQIAGRLVKNLDFIGVGLLSKLKNKTHGQTIFSSAPESQIGKLFQQRELVVQRLVEHLFGDLIMGISLQLIE